MVEEVWRGARYLEQLVGSQRYLSIRTIPASVGDTDYLDTVDRSELHGAALCKGTDPLNRPFVCFRVTVVRAKNRQVYEEDAVYTLFQRYTDDDSVFVLCPSHATRNVRAFAGVVQAETLVTASARAALCLFFHNGVLTEDGYICTLVGSV